MREFAKSILDTVRHPLLILDESLRVATANRHYYEMFDVTPEESERKLLFDLERCGWDSLELRESLQTVVQHGQSVENLEVSREVPRLGRRIFMLNARRVYRDDETEIPMIFLGIEDVTDLREVTQTLRALNSALTKRVSERTAELEAANRELQLSNRQLLAANRELEAFCFSVSHDLRAPLRAVDGFSQELINSYSYQLDEQAQHYLRRVRYGVQRMGTLIDDLLKLSRINRSEMACDHVDLSAMAESVSADLCQLDRQRRVTWNVQPGLQGYCDARLIRVVLDNLLGNAWKFTAKKPDAKIEFCQTLSGERTAFCIRDDGVGFDMAYVGKLFGAFQRLHPDREFPGTGVGLATVQRIIRKHGGEVWAEGAVGRGAAFYFTLPERESLNESKNDTID